MRIGLVKDFSNLPQLIKLGDEQFFLVQDGSQFKLLSILCPHMGGVVDYLGHCFTCPQHDWQFDKQTGAGINNSRRLTSVPVFEESGVLFADFQRLPPKASTASVTSVSAADLTIQLHTHACLEIRLDGFSLLTDPWICGPAFMGSWTHFPQPVVDIDALDPGAVLITHEHSDHFHEPTLRKFARSTPVYFPDFPNRRIEERLLKLGFQHLTPMAFGTTHKISDACSFTPFEPTSLWNDSIILMDFKGTTMLNTNDAGVNHRIAREVGAVDIVLGQFSGGASGYPLTWNHLNSDQKAAIVERGSKGKLQMLQEMTELYRSTYLLPFASHFSLWHPSHREYVRQMHMNTLDDVVEGFSNSDVGVIDLMPGETWDLKSGAIERIWTNRQTLYTKDYLLRHLEETFDRDVFNEYHPSNGGITRSEIEQYFLTLNAVPEMVFCESIVVQVKARDSQSPSDDCRVVFEVKNGRLTILKHEDRAPDITIEIPKAVLKSVVVDNISWDEAQIGYWCRTNRSSDYYHADFWRLLQAPYYKKNASISPQTDVEITENSVIGEVLEQYGQQADRIIRRYGLYCVGCQHSAHESISQSAETHGLEPYQVARLVTELNRALGQI